MPRDRPAISDMPSRGMHGRRLMVQDDPAALGVGLVGSGFMGKRACLRLQRGVADLRPAAEARAGGARRPDEDAGGGGGAAARLCAGRSATGRRWSNDPAVDVVAITAPNALHKPIALAALQAGKAVYCEKPLAATLADAKEMAEAARSLGPGDARRLQLPEEPDHRPCARDRRVRRDRRARSPSAASTPRTT